MFAESGVRLSGAPASYSLQNSAGNTVTRLFCAQCGSPLFGKNTGMPGFMTVMMGTLDSSERLVPQVAVFCRSRQHWDPEITTVQGFDAQPAWKPE